MTQKIYFIIIIIILNTNILAKNLSSVPGVTSSANISLTSNYIWRGYTKTRNTPAFQAGFDLGHDSGLYLGTWGSSITNGTEWDLYGGFVADIFGLYVDFGYIHYAKTFVENIDSNNKIVSYTTSFNSIKKSDTAEGYIGFTLSIFNQDIGFKTSYDMTKSKYYEDRSGVSGDSSSYIVQEASIGFNFEYFSIYLLGGAHVESGKIYSTDYTYKYSFIESSLKIPSLITGGNWGLTISHKALVSSSLSDVNTDSLTLYAISHSFNF